MGLAALWVTPAAAEIRATDVLGREIVLEQPARRIVSLAPHITEVVYAAGAGEKLVGAVSYSDYPEAAKALPRVGSYKKVSLEPLVELEPDLVLVWLSGNGEDLVAQLESLGLRTFVQEPRTLQDVAETLIRVGQLAGTEAAAESSAAQFLERYAALKSRYSEQRAVTVYYQIWNEPLLTLNGDHLISDVIRLCGGENAFADATPLVSRISVESVLLVDPQVIVASGMDEARPDWLDDWLDWPALTAVDNEQLYFVPPDLLQRHTPRIIDGAEILCRHLERARATYYLD
ncbi:MAG: cobalamin-binding protein [Pseudomonadota bacterium]